MILEYNDYDSFDEFENNWLAIHSDLLLDLIEVFSYGD